MGEKKESERKGERKKGRQETLRHREGAEGQRDITGQGGRNGGGSKRERSVSSTLGCGSFLGNSHS
jgi:hypothetical protein